MNIHVSAPSEEPQSDLALADARKAVEAETGRIPTGPRAGGNKVYVSGELFPDLRLHSPMDYWLLLAPRSTQRPEVRDFAAWLEAEAGRMREAAGGGAEK